MKEADINSIILDFVHSETGWGTPLRPHCELDGFSQYDKTHVLDGDVIINVSGKISEFELKEIHTGVAANISLYTKQDSKE